MTIAGIRNDQDQLDTSALRERARHNLFQHFTRRDQLNGDFPVYASGDGCYLTDTDGNRVLDGLSGLFCVNMGHGRHDIAEAGARQLHRLAYASNWGSATEPAIAAAGLIADLAPGDLETTFFVNSGSEAVETAIKFARQYHRSQGEPQRTKFVSRNMAYHGVTMGALSITQLDQIKDPFRPLLNEVHQVSNTLGQVGDCGPAAELPSIRAVEQVIQEEGPETIAALFAEPVQNGRGALVPPDGYWRELRRICDEHGILLVSDEVICSFGRLGHWFGEGLTGVVPDLVTFAKGSTSGYAPLGGMIARRPLVEALYESDQGGVFTHGATWGGHPVSTAVAHANISAMRDEDILGNVRRRGPGLKAELDRLMEAHNCVKDVRGTGYFYALEITADRADGRELTREEHLKVLREILPAAFKRTGVALRGDDRGGTMLMVSPPLVAQEDDLAHLVRGIDGMLEDIGKGLR